MRLVKRVPRSHLVGYRDMILCATFITLASCKGRKSNVPGVQCHILWYGALVNAITYTLT